MIQVTSYNLRTKLTMLFLVLFLLLIAAFLYARHQVERLNVVDNNLVNVAKFDDWTEEYGAGLLKTVVGSYMYTQGTLIMADSMLAEGLRQAEASREKLQREQSLVSDELAEWFAVGEDMMNVSREIISVSKHNAGPSAVSGEKNGSIPHLESNHFRLLQKLFATAQVKHELLDIHSERQFKAMQQQREGIVVRIINEFIVGLLFALVLFLLLIRQANCRLLKPIEALSIGIKRISDGNLSARVAVYGHDELAVLGDYFNTMAATVQDQVKQLNAESERAELASRAKSEFVANMSHEIRTPLNGVVGMLDLLNDEMLPDSQQELVHTAQFSANHLMSVINDILDFSKIEAGKMELEQIEFNLDDMLNYTLKSMASLVHKKELELNMNSLDRIPATLTGDPGRVRQVITNMISNAIKFTEQGEINIRVENYTSSLDCPELPQCYAEETITEDEVCLLFCIQDTGIGISDAEKEHIFNAFEQADATTTRRHGGTGLGLSICSRLVSLMGGRVWLESEPGKGSTFYFSAHFGIPKQKPTAALPALPLQGVSVLVVDDNATNRCILIQYCRRWGMRVSEAVGGDQALVQMQQACDNGDPFHLVLLDCHMPGRDGFGVAEAMRDHPEWCKATVMMLTSGGIYGDGKRCRNLGVGAYLVKPVSVTELQHAVQQLLGSGTDMTSASELVTRHTLREAAPHLRMLVAEDDPINQMTLQKMLDKRGHQVTIVGNGAAAVDVFRSQSFDLVLMDVQMPIMDGREATRRIRAIEAENDKHGHTPIFALTAHASHEERDACLAAGMDEHLTKPLTRQVLEDNLDHYFSADGRCYQASVQTGLGERAPESVDSPQAEILKPEYEAMDQHALLDHVEGDRVFLGRLVELFAKRWPEIRADMAQAMNDSDMERLGELRHALRGQLATLFAHPAMALLDKQKQLQGDAAVVLAQLDDLDTEIKRLLVALHTLTQAEDSK